MTSTRTSIVMCNLKISNKYKQSNMHYTGLFDIMQFHHFRIGEEIYIKGNNVALIIQFGLCSIRCANL